MARKIETPILFARVGWMDFYNGVESERPIGGGKYTRTAIGHEAFNFKAVDGQLYGYFQPQMASSKVNLERIVSSTTASKLEEVLLIFVATWPARRERRGQTIVGWYAHATVYRERRKQAPGHPKGYGFFCTTNLANAVLLPTQYRQYAVPTGKGGFGQANVCYPLSARRAPKSHAWMTNATAFVLGYTGPNLLSDPLANIVTPVETLVENALRRSEGQGRGLTPSERQAVEKRAMQKAQRFYRKRGYKVKDVHLHRSYDLECRRNSEVVHVEVKGTTTEGNTVFLTPREREHAEFPTAINALYILHSIKLKGTHASGGEEKVIDPWQLKQGNLVATGYQYTV